MLIYAGSECLWQIGYFSGLSARAIISGENRMRGLKACAVLPKAKSLTATFNEFLLRGRNSLSPFWKLEKSKTRNMAARNMHKPTERAEATKL